MPKNLLQFLIDHGGPVLSQGLRAAVEAEEYEKRIGGPSCECCRGDDPPVHAPATTTRPSDDPAEPPFKFCDACAAKFDADTQRIEAAREKENPR